MKRRFMAFTPAPNYDIVIVGQVIGNVQPRLFTYKFPKEEEK